MFGWDSLRTGLRVADYFDMAVIAVLVYLALRWFGKRTARAGLFVLAGLILLYIVARWLGMFVTLAFFQVGLSVFLIGLIVIFQQDIRNWFEHLTFMWHLRRHGPADPDMTDRLVEALEAMADNRTGALIVLQGQQPVDGHIRGGIRLRGEVSIPILQSIFYRKSPGHDGAVIIKGNRLDRFAAHLPLSKKLADIGFSGTRHTAALGLAECCDALVLVVSEERGTLSIAENGKLETLACASELKHRVMEFYQQRFPRRQQRFAALGLFKKLGLKITAVVAAVLLWGVFFFQNEVVQRTADNVAIEYLNVPKEWVIMHTKPAKLRITLTGPKRAFDNLEAKPLTASVDLKNLDEGEHEIPITADQLRLPPGISVRHLDTKTVKFQAYRVVQVEVPIKPDLRGDVPFGYLLGKIEVLPQKVALLVPQKEQTTIKAVRTEPIFLMMLDRSTVLKPKLIVPDNTRFLGDQQPTVRLAIQLKREAPSIQKSAVRPLGNVERTK